MKEVYTFGKVKLTQQALAVLITGFVGSLLSLLVLSRTMGFKLAFVISLVTLGLAFYQTYLVNCTVVGKCNELAWFLLAMYAFSLVTYPAMTLLIKNKKGNSPV